MINCVNILWADLILKYSLRTLKVAENLDDFKKKKVVRFVKSNRSRAASVG